MTIETERLVLRMFREGDLDAYASICGDERVMRYIGEGRALTRGEAWRQMAFFLGHWALRGFGMLAVEERASGAMIGRIGFHHPEGWPGFELGWVLHPAAWGRGYATEGARAALDHAFRDMGREHVISVIHPDNHASIRVAERLGQRLEGTVRLGAEVLVYGIRRPAAARPDEHGILIPGQP